MRQKKLKHLQWLCRQYFSGEVHLDLGGLNVRLKQECSLFWRETFSSSSILQWLHVAFNWSVYRRFRRAILIANRIRCAAACHLDMCCRVRPGDTHRSPKAQCTTEFCGAWFYIRYNRTARIRCCGACSRIPSTVSWCLRIRTTGPNLWYMDFMFLLNTVYPLGHLEYIWIEKLVRYNLLCMG